MSAAYLWDDMEQIYWQSRVGRLAKFYQTSNGNWIMDWNPTCKERGFTAVFPVGLKDEDMEMARYLSDLSTENWVDGKPF